MTNDNDLVLVRRDDLRVLLDGPPSSEYGEPLRELVKDKRERYARLLAAVNGEATTVEYGGDDEHGNDGTMRHVGPWIPKGEEQA